MAAGFFLAPLAAAILAAAVAPAGAQVPAGLAALAVGLAAAAGVGVLTRGRRST